MKLLFIQSASPHGSINAQEGLDAVLMGSAFVDCAVLFVGDGVLQLLKDQEPEPIGRKNFAMTFGALADYGVSDIYCDARALDTNGLDPGDLVIDAEPLDEAAIRALIASSDKVLNF